MRVIVGLGNPGHEYANTRHNVGFWVIDRLSDAWRIPLLKEKWKAIVGEGWIHNEKVLLVKPQTYMNLSGEAVRKICNFFQLELTQLLVIYDDLDLPVGKIRLRVKGSSGGHNGMKSIIEHLHSKHIQRIKIGIGRPKETSMVTEYVLSPFAENERAIIEEAVEQSAQAVEAWLQYGFQYAMNQYN